MDDYLLFVVRPMTLADIDQIMSIEQVAFSAPWSPRAYRYEVAESDHSTMLVVQPAPRRGWPWRAAIDHLLGTAPGPVLGYAGGWHLVDEVHISTIAVHPQWRRRGLAQLLLLSLLERGLELGVQQATLEVRVSNQAAQALYQKYGFEIASRQKAYYSDNNEDALIMVSPDLRSPGYQVTLRQLRLQLSARLRNPAEIRRNVQEL